MKETAASIGRLIQAAQRDDASEKRTDLFDRYMGEPYGDEVEGRSSFISTDVSDAVEAILPDILDVFTSAEGLVEFLPVGPEDEEAARQETEVVEHIFWQKNRGFEILYTWFKEALIQQNAYVKRGWDDRERVEIEEYEELTGEELAQIIQGKASKGIEYEIEELDGGDADEMGMPTPIRAKIRCVSREKRYVIEAIPQEEFFVSPRWNSVSLEGVPCCGQKQRIERGELLRMGFSEESVEKATSKEVDEYQTASRFDTRDAFEGDDDRGDDKSTQEVTVYEAYCRVDINDDGRAELVRAWASGDGSTLLQWEGGRDAVDEVSCIPYSCLTPYIVPHRHVGRSVAELVDDIQKVKTVLFRHTLDNVYAINYARPHVDETLIGPNTLTDLANPAHGAPVRTGGALVEYQRPPSVIDTTLPIIAQMDDLKEMRTGATRYNQGLDANSLNKTSSGITKIMNASQKKTLLVARTFAETGMRDLFLGIHRDLRSGPMKELAVKLRGKWVQVNPRLWADRTDMTVTIGGSSREQRREGLMLLGQLQRELVAGQSRMVDDGKIYNLAGRMLETYGFKGLAEFLNDPAQLPPEPPAQPDPMLMMQQEQLRIADEQGKRRDALAGLKLQMDHQARMQEMALKAQAEERQALKVAADIQIAGEKHDLDRKATVMDDDFKRDKLKADAATGYMREGEALVQSDPPVDYGNV
jgi:hypothetical protein